MTSRGQPPGELLKPLRSLPGIGPSLAADLWDLGYAAPDDLRGQNPEAMYARLAKLRGTHQDRCVLYVFRCAVYAAQGGADPEKLKWWNWKDSAAPGSRSGRSRRRSRAARRS